MLTARLSREVTSALEEAADCVRFLKPLRPLVQQIVEPSDFTALLEVFGPLMQTMLLIWTHSRHFNSPVKLLALMRRLCNALVVHARAYMPGADPRRSRLHECR